MEQNTVFTIHSFFTNHKVVSFSTFCDPFSIKFMITTLIVK